MMKWVYREQNGKRRSERGSILAVSAVGMVAILMAVGLAVDISHLYLVGTELQNGADASALAGASALNSYSDGITKAVDRAVVAMNNYEFNGTSATINREDVRFAVNLSAFDGGGTGMSEADAAAAPANIRFVQVTVPPKSVSIFFATLALAGSPLVSGGGNSVDLTRRAVAGQSVALNLFCNIAPFSVVQDDVTGAPLNVNPECPNQTVFTPGCTYVFRLSSGGGGNGNGNGNGGGGISAGNYLILALGGDRGGADVRRRLGLGSDSCHTIGETVSTEPGITAGPVRQGINTRFDIYQGGGLDPADFPPDTNIMQTITYAEFANGNPSQAPTHPGVPDRRVIIIPIINKSEYDPGRDEVRIAKFAAFFLKTEVGGGNGGDLSAEYIGTRVGLGDGGFNPDGDLGDPQLTVPVLYR